MIPFRDMTHKARFYNLLQEDETCEGDNERKALFYIISGNDELYDKRQTIYDFTEHMIKPTCLKGKWLSTGLKNLVKWGFNLYNGSGNINPNDIISTLDNDNLQLALRAIGFRVGEVVKC